MLAVYSLVNHVINRHVQSEEDRLKEKKKKSEREVMLRYLQLINNKS